MDPPEKPPKEDLPFNKLTPRRRSTASSNDSQSSSSSSSSSTSSSSSSSGSSSSGAARGDGAPDIASQLLNIGASFRDVPTTLQTISNVNTAILRGVPIPLEQYPLVAATLVALAVYFIVPIRALLSISLAFFVSAMYIYNALPYDRFNSIYAEVDTVRRDPNVLIPRVLPYVLPLLPRFLTSSFHEYMTQGSFVRDHKHLLVYFLPNLTADQMESIARTLPDNRRDMMLMQGGVGRSLGMPEWLIRDMMAYQQEQRQQQEQEDRSLLLPAPLGVRVASPNAIELVDGGDLFLHGGEEEEQGSALRRDGGAASASDPRVVVVQSSTPATASSVTIVSAAPSLERTGSTPHAVSVSQTSLRVASATPRPAATLFRSETAVLDLENTLIDNILTATATDAVIGYARQVQSLATTYADSALDQVLRGFVQPFLRRVSRFSFTMSFLSLPLLATPLLLNDSLLSRIGSSSTPLLANSAPLLRTIGSRASSASVQFYGSAVVIGLGVTALVSRIGYKAIDSSLKKKTTDSEGQSPDSGGGDGSPRRLF